MDQKMADHLFGDVADTFIVEQRAEELRALADAGFMPMDEEPAEWHEEHPELTEEEMAEGQRFGETIDIDDDEDNGGVT